ncbi:MAG: hypothetical protein MJZ98_00595 [Paludibacteraceae bacterium]|nr:hypothetical protein [Paludibacteraceae bacterium]
MEKIRIGILEESKVKTDNRAPITPNDVAYLLSRYGERIEVIFQPSKHRCFSDEEYINAGATSSEDLSMCDILFGIKEVLPNELIKGHRYFFFGHIREDKPYEYPLLKGLVEKRCTFYDYEAYNGNKRLSDFSYYAGAVGAYNTLRLYGLREEMFSLQPAESLKTLANIVKELNEKYVFFKLSENNAKIVVTGNGVAAQGAKRILDLVSTQCDSEESFLESKVCCYYLATKENLIVKKNGEPFDRADFDRNPEKYMSRFLRYSRNANILIACHNWEMGQPELFTEKMARDEKRKLKYIGDIVCDINGSICTTLRHSSHDNPFYDVRLDEVKLYESFPFVDKNAISVMAVDTLPNAVAREASEAFSRTLCSEIIENAFLSSDWSKIYKAAQVINGRIYKESTKKDTMKNMLKIMNVRAI